MLKMFSSVFSISIASFGLPLGCLNLASFFNKLIFMMLFPVVLCLLIVLGCVVSSGLIAKLLQLVARVLSLFGAARPRPGRLAGATVLENCATATCGYRGSC